MEKKMVEAYKKELYISF